MKLFLQFLAAMLVGTVIGAYALPKITSQGNNDKTYAAQSNIRSDSSVPDAIVDNLQQQLLDAGKERKKLEQQIEQLRDQQGNNDFVAINQNERAAIDSDDSLPGPPSEIRELIQQRRNPQNQQQRLVDAGFSLDEIDAIERAAADYQTARIEERLAEMRANPEEYEQQLDPRGYQPIRAELGDERFEEYLRANGSNPDIVARNVIPGSAAELAGIQSGDQIYSYDGNRIFQTGDVTRGTISGTLNESVIIEVKRDDQIISLSAPRGTLGVTLGNAGRRFGGRRGP